MTQDRKKILVIVGTRPEAIKLAPVIHEIRARADSFSLVVVTTGQHRQMLDQMLVEFGIVSDLDLDIMRHDQSLVAVTCVALHGLYDVIGAEQPSCVIVQGDTTTTFAGALAAAYHQVPVAHVEAGLRTFDRRNPFPEELNRCLTSQMCEYFFAPTERARSNLLREGYDESTIWVTGNTAIDALLFTVARQNQERGARANGRRILVTAHRRENHGAPLANICRAILQVLARHEDTAVVFPVHLNPRVRETVHDMLGEHPRVNLCEPMDYTAFVTAMRDSHVIITDSGGVQEEAPSLGKPVLVLRERTERTEAIEAGTARLVGTDVTTIVDAASELLSDESAYRAMARVENPFGDGRAAARIVDVLAEQLGAPTIASYTRAESR